MRASQREKVCYWPCIVLMACSVWPSGTRSSSAEDGTTPPDFSGSLIKKVDGRRAQAQVFAKADRIRLEYKYAIKTERGYASIEIIRLDKSETWYVLAQRKELLVTSVVPQEVLPIRPALPGEKERVVVGPGQVVGREARLYDVLTIYNGRTERFFQWVDRETGIVLKLVSQNRDWSIEYERFHVSPQPDSYFAEPPGYTKYLPPLRNIQG